ncbi:hypothetical protein GW17_00004624 [Ensete ventricosum]|nr:hypothetical protein GW17_00004624 [Ensete ventricosum]
MVNLQELRRMPKITTGCPSSIARASTPQETTIAPPSTLEGSRGSCRGRNKAAGQEGDEVNKAVAAAKRRAVEFQVETERKRVELEEVFRQQGVLEKELNESGFLLSNTQ